MSCTSCSWRSVVLFPRTATFHLGKWKGLKKVSDMPVVGADMTIVLQKTQRVSSPDLRQHQTGWCNWSSVPNRFMWPMGRYGRKGMVEMFLI